jgi:hypothetical protein
LVSALDRDQALQVPPVTARVSGLGAGETTSIDVRLPFEAIEPSATGLQPRLFVSVDSRQELEEFQETNNLAELDRLAIPVVAPSVSVSGMQ